MDFDTRELVELLVREAYHYALPAVRDASKFLAAEMREIVVSPVEGRVEIPVYWAVFVHEGREGPILPRNSKVLVYFRNPLVNDPRLDGGYPRQRSDLKTLHLSPDQWKSLLDSGQMIVRRRVDKPVPPHRFFSLEGGMAGFQERAQQIANEWASRKINEALGGEFKLTLDVVL